VAGSGEFIALERPRRRTASALFLVLGVALMIAAAATFGLAIKGELGSGSGVSGPGTVTGFGSVMSAATPFVQPTPAAGASSAPLERLIIPSVRIDAPVVVKGLDENSVMESPDNAWDVAWYDFSARPGAGGNAVFSGHVDYVNVGPAVFWRLKELQAGDRIDVRFADGDSLSYGVTALNTFDAATAPIDRIVGPTSTDSITLITCAGTFDQRTRQYDKRLIVRAERIS